MRADVKHVYSPDVDLDSGRVEDLSDFCISVRLIVGPVGGSGGDSFDLMVCTPTWIGRRILETGPVVGRHFLLVNHFSGREIKDFLRRQVGSLDGKDWKELAGKIGRIGMWEFEDYG